MKRSVVRSLILCSMIGALLVLTISLPAQDVFRARLITSGGPIQEKMLSLKITIDSFTTKDEVRQLQKVLNESGTSKFLRAFRKTKKGIINFLGARGMSMRINAAQSILTESGRKILVFTERQSWDSEITVRVSGKYLFIVIELEIDKNWKVTGKFYPGANIQMTREGTIEIESFQPPKMLVGVRKVK